MVTGSTTTPSTTPEGAQLSSELLLQQDVVLQLAQDTTVFRGDESHVFAQITEAATQGLNVARAGIWLFNADHSAIELKDIYIAPTKQHTAGEVLQASDCPAYFDALKTVEHAIEAHDALTDPRTAEFATPYLKPNGIGAMLDAPVRRNGEVIGILCNEHLGGPRHWTIADQQFAAYLANFVTLAIETAERQRVERQFARFFELSLDLLCIAGTDGYFKTINPAFERVLGYNEQHLLGEPFVEFVHPEDRASTLKAVKKLAQGELVVDFINRYRAADGNYCTLSWRAAPCAEEGFIYAVARDITKERLLERQLVQAQKLEAIGKLAGGVAHDFNNILMAIQSSTEFAARAIPENAPATKDLEDISSSVKRASGLTKQLLSFARRQTIAVQTVDLRDVMNDLKRMLTRLIRQDIETIWNLSPTPLNVQADVTQLQQVILNLVLNAQDAMPNGGAITVSAHPTELSEDHAMFLVETDGFKAGNYAKLEVLDEGDGVDTDMRAHIFEPFFTTKKEGSGLGLAVVYGIVRQHQGFVGVESEPHGGTAVQVYLPLSVPGPKRD